MWRRVLLLFAQLGLLVRGQTLTLGAVLSLNDPSVNIRNSSQAFLLAAQMAVHDVNTADPPILPLGYSFELLSFDSGSQIGAIAAAIAANSSGAIAAIGETTSDNTEVSSLTFEGFNSPECSGSATNTLLSDKTQYPYFFRTIVTDAQLGNAVVDYIYSLGWQRIALISSNDIYGQGLAGAVQAECARLAISIVMSQSYPAGGSPLSALIQLQQTSARIVIVATLDVIDFMSAAYSLGLVSSQYVWFAFEADILTQTLPSNYNVSALSGLFWSSATEGYGSVASQFSAAWPAAFSAAFPGLPVQTIPSPDASYYYDCVLSYAYLFSQALEISPNTTNYGADVLTPLLQSLSFIGASGNVSFDANGDRQGGLINIENLFLDQNNNPNTQIIASWIDSIVSSTNIAPLFFGNTTTLPRDTPLAAVDSQQQLELTALQQLQSVTQPLGSLWLQYSSASVFAIHPCLQVPVLPFVKCNSNGHIVALNLSRNNLFGPLPNVIGNFVSLKSLDLSGNELIGQIPSTFNSLLSLTHIDLSDNSFDGALPSLVCLSSFSYCNLLGSSQSYCSPTQDGACTGCEIILNNYCDPTTISKRDNELQALKDLVSTTKTSTPWINYNTIDTTVHPCSLLTPPPAFITCQNGFIVSINLSANGLNGVLLPSMVSFSQLQTLNLSNNVLTGSIPNFGNITTLKVLDLSNNSFSGQLPASICLVVYETCSLLGPNQAYCTDNTPSCAVCELVPFDCTAARSAVWITATVLGCLLLFFVAVFAILHARFPSANNIAVIPVLLMLFALMMDILLINFLGNQLSGRPQLFTLFIVACVFLVLPIIVNAFVVLYFLWRRLYDKREWVKKHALVTSIVLVLSSLNLESLALLNSHILGLEFFWMNWDDIDVNALPVKRKDRTSGSVSNQLLVLGLLSIFFQHLPQFIIQIQVVTLTYANAVAYLAIASSLLCIMFGLSRRLFRLMLFLLKPKNV